MPSSRNPGKTVPESGQVVHVLGLGQDLGDLPPSRERLIREAEILAAGERLHIALPWVRALRVVLKAPLEPVLEQLARAADEGRRVVVLAGGDPCFFGIGPLLVRRLGADRVRLHPGTTTVQAAAALLGIAWQDAAVVSLHGREDPAPVFASLFRNLRVAVYTDEKNTPAAIAKMLLKRGAGHFAMWVFENLGLPGGRHARFTLEHAREREFSPLNLVLLERLKEPTIRLTLGLEDEAYIHEQGLITKRVVRAAALAALRLEPFHVLWDLGAGCGAVGIEAGLLLPRGQVLAVEREQKRVAMIRKNIRRTHAFWVRPVLGLMPGCLARLPEPDRVFLGGGLSGGDGVLEAAWAKLKSGGRLVAAAVLLDSMRRARNYLEQNGRNLEITQVQAGQAVPLAGDLRLAAQNPVFLVAADKTNGSPLPARHKGSDGGAWPPE